MKKTIRRGEDDQGGEEWERQHNRVAESEGNGEPRSRTTDGPLRARRLGSAPASARSAAAGCRTITRLLSLVDLVLGEAALLGLLFQQVERRLVLVAGLLAGGTLLLGAARDGHGRHAVAVAPPSSRRRPAWSARARRCRTPGCARPRPPRTMIMISSSGATIFMAAKRPLLLRHGEW